LRARWPWRAHSTAVALNNGSSQLSR